MPFISIYFLVFGALTIAGGVMGYVKAGSVASLVAGSISGILLLGGGFLVSSQPPSQGVLAGLGLVCLALGYRFVTAFLKGGGFMPAGLMASLSVVGLVLIVLAFVQSSK